MKKLKKQNGITLVALVITIIILLILAGISISALTNQGLFEKSKEAKEKSEAAQRNESIILENYLAQMNVYDTNNSKTEEEKFENVDKTKTNPEAAMPRNASVVECDANKGIVIKDSNNNEWTWVEVPKTTVFTTAKKADEYDKIKADLREYSKDYREGKTGQGLNWEDEWYDGCGIVAENGKTGEEIYAEMYNKMLSSVYTNGGFWISRYEAGIAETNTDATKNEIQNVRAAHSDITNESPKAVSQANRIPYNYVYCSEAQKLASEMSTDSSKTSSLLFGIQWDLTCKFLQEKGKLSVAQIKSGDGVGSINWGNYINSSIILTKGKYNTIPSNSDSKWVNITSDAKNAQMLLTTGASEAAHNMNIYDFAGNEWEWTLEHATSDTRYPCARRGGSFKHTSSDTPVAYRDDNSTSSSNDDVGFRSTLY